MSLLLIFLNGCNRYYPPYNQFKPYHRSYSTTTSSALVGTTAIALAGGPLLVGTGAGMVIGGGLGAYKESKRVLIERLKRHQIQFIPYGDTTTFVIPTDRYFMFNSPRLNPICHTGLALLVQLIKAYPPCCPIYVAAFSNSIGSPHHKKTLTQAQAEAMLTFLWANGLPAQRLNAEGYADKYPVSDNRLVHGSAQNRRLEIQVLCNCSQTTAWTGYIK